MIFFLTFTMQNAFVLEVLYYLYQFVDILLKYSISELVLKPSH